MNTKSAITHFEVQDLFGYLDHSIDFRPSDPTIITGPNGVGKTHVLTLIRNILLVETDALARTPFSHARLALADGSIISVSRSQDERSRTPASVHLELRSPFDAVTAEAEFRDTITGSLPPWIEYQDGEFFDKRDNEVLSRSQILLKYGDHELDREQSAQRNSLRRAIGTQRCSMIDTRRLSGRLQAPRRSPQFRRPYPMQQRPLHSVSDYFQLISTQISRAQDESLDTSQKADLTFAERALAAATKTVREDDLRKRYNSVVSQVNSLAHNGLTVNSQPIPFPEHTNPTIRRIMDPFVEDWEKRLAPLLPLNEKIDLYRSLLDKRLEASFKQTAARKGTICIANSHGQAINESKLSSGEQHLVAMYTKLLFDTRPNSVVLIDEPEISLHPAWQHAFLGDVIDLSEHGGFQVVIATHSPTIVNGRWDLEEILTMTEPPAYDSRPDAEEDADSADDAFESESDDAE